MLQRALLVCVLWLAAFSLGTAFAGEEGLAVDLVGTVVYDVPVALAAALTIVAARRAERPHRRFWQLLAVSNVGWFAGDLSRGIIVLGLGRELPFPSLADVFYLSSYAVVWPAVLVGFRPALSTRVWRVILDTSVTVAAVGYVGWALLIRPQVTGGMSLATATSVAYPLVDLAIVMFLVSFGYAAHRGLPVSVGLVSLGFLATALTDTSNTYLAVFNDFVPGSWLRLGWQVEALLFCLGALVVIRHREPGPRADLLRRDAGLAVVLLGAAAATTVVAVEFLNGRTSVAGLILAGYALAAVVLRLHLSTREKYAIAHRLDESLARLHSTLESTADGILVLDSSGRIIEFNRRFLELWRIPAEIAEAGDDDRALEFAVGQLANPEGFLAEVRELYADPEADSFNGIEFRDGRVLERYSQPLRLRGVCAGRVWSFRDVTERRQVEKTMRESEQRLRLALEAGHMGWWEWDLASDRIHWSESLERLNGLEPGTFGGTLADFLATIHPDDRDEVAQTTDSALADSKSDIVYRIVRPDGAVRWIEDMGKVIRDDDGRPIKMIGVERDISERKRAEALAALQQQVLEGIAAGVPLAAVLERLMRLVEELSEDALASVLLLDEDGLHLRHGAAPSLPDTYNQAVDGIAIGPQVGSCGTAAYRGEPVVVSDIASDPLWAEARELALADGLRACWSTPLIGSDSDVLGTFAMYYREPRLPTAGDLELIEAASHVARIAIERAGQQAKLARAEQKYRRLVEQLPLAVYTFAPDANGLGGRAHTDYVSPQIEPMLGYSRDEWRADPELFAKVLHPDDRERVRAEIRRARASAHGFRGEFRLVAKDGRVVWVQDESVYLRDEEGEMVAVEGFLVDISERKALESGLLQTQKMEAVGQLAGGIAHDFNNLMTAVIGFGELALGRLDGQDPVRAQVAQIVRAGERAAAMTNQLLAFSRQQILQPRVLDLNAVVADSDKLLRRLIGEDIAVTCVLDPELEPVLADPVHLEQVIVNLAVNARDAMPTGGRLTIETANVELDSEYAASHFELESGRYVLLAVSDTGVGMDAETQARIFEPFFTTKGEGEGTGLGLATVFGIVKQSGGDVSVYSEPGRGTTFKLYLPRAEHPAEQRERQPARECPPRGSETVLLVEDEELVRDLERHVLEQCGYVVLEAADPRQALEIAAAHEAPIHLLLTDVVMPEMSGRELAERLTPARPEMKVLYSSGYPDDSVVRHGVLEAEVAFLTKPFTLAALAAKVREVLDASAASVADAYAAVD